MIIFYARTATAAVAVAVAVAVAEELGSNNYEQTVHEVTKIKTRVRIR